MAKLLVCILVWLTAAPLAFAGDVRLGDEITAGIRTDVEHEGRPFGYRVVWINWDSAFRDSDLRLGDKIVGVNNYRYTRGAYSKHHAIGDYQESTYWKEQSAKDRHAITLIVNRNGRELSVPGAVRANRFYFNDAGERTMGEGGPVRNSYGMNESGGRMFSRTWATWYEEKISSKAGSFAYNLDGSWERAGFNNRQALEAHLEDEPRIAYAVANHPSKFSSILKEDWERVGVYLAGERVDLPADALAYRTRQEELQREIKTYADQAAAAFATELGDKLETSPSVGRDGVEDQRKNYLGKVVYFDGLTQRNIINDLEQSFLVAGDNRKGYYFADAEGPVMGRIFDALLRYRGLINPRVAERYSVYVEVLDEPRIITFRGSPVMGLLGKVVGFAAGRNDVFIDARPETGALRFAGEEETKVEAPCAVKAGEPPAVTVACMVEAVKYGDRDTWQSLFADWRLSVRREGEPPLYDPNYQLRPSIYESAWQSARRNIMGDVHDARVSRTDPSYVLFEGDAANRIPKVEEVRVILDHIGQIDGKYRTYVKVGLGRVWHLQRRDGGPWKIITVKNL